MSQILEIISENRRLLVERNMQELYSKFGLDISKAIRSLADLTDKEARKFGEIFHRELSPWIVVREISEMYYPFEGDSKGIKLFSRSEGIIDKIKESEHPNEFRSFILLFSNGEIYKRGLVYIGEKDRNYDESSKYLCSLGIRTFDFPEERLNKK